MPMRHVSDERIGLPHKRNILTYAVLITYYARTHVCAHARGTCKSSKEVSRQLCSVTKPCDYDVVMHAHFHLNNYIGAHRNTHTVYACRQTQTQ